MRTFESPTGASSGTVRFRGAKPCRPRRRTWAAALARGAFCEVSPTMSSDDSESGKINPANLPLPSEGAPGAGHLEVSELARLYSSDSTVRALCDHMAARDNNQRETKLERLLQRIDREGYSSDRSQVIAALRRLEAVGCGRYVEGRRGWPSRFVWSIPSRTVSGFARADAAALDGEGLRLDGRSTNSEPVNGSADHEQELQFEDEDSGSDTIVEPFDPTKIRIETKPLTVDLLVKRIREDEIDLATSFQRRAGLWSDHAQSRLVESLLTRIPLPAFYMDASDEDHWLVVDGLQRLTVFRRFIIDQELALSNLEFLTSYNGKKFSQLPRSLQRRIEETQVTAYLIQPGTPPEVKFNIFKRINTGGVPLSPQEIRHALNQGPAAEMLEDLAEEDVFQTVAGQFLRDGRMTDRECVLRFLAFVISPYEQYGASRDLDGFLNEQMRRLNDMPQSERDTLEQRFVRSMRAAEKLFGDDAFRKRYREDDRRKPINKALFEAWSVNLDRLGDAELSQAVQRRAAVRAAFIRLMANREFEAAISQGTGDVRKVQLRFGEIATLLKEVLQ